MVLVEAIADQYLQSWQSQPQSRVIPEAASVLLEASHLPETYSFSITNAGFVDQNTGLPVKSFMEKQTTLGQIEYSAFEQIEKRGVEQANSKQFGITAIWISPPHVNRSPDTKIILTWALNSQSGPIARNECLLLEGDSHLSLDIANMILLKTGSIRMPFVDTEVLRGTPLLYKGPVNITEIYEKILEMVQNHQGLLELKNGNVDKIQADADKWAKAYVDSRFGNASIAVPQVEAKHSASCPPLPTASEVLIKNGEVYKFVRNCGNCGIGINDFIPNGYRCKFCGGVYRGC